MLSISRGALALFFVGAGMAHFILPAPYRAIMPPFVPWPGAMVMISGLLEIVGGAAVVFPAARLLAGWGLIALLVAVFPANVYAISTGMMVGGHAAPAWMLWARLPFQVFFIGWVYHACLRKSPNE